MNMYLYAKYILNPMYCMCLPISYFTQTAFIFICLGWNSLSGYCQVDSILVAITLPHMQSISLVITHTTENSVHHKMSQVKAVCVNWVDLPLWASMAVSVITSSHTADCYFTCYWLLASNLLCSSSKLTATFMSNISLFPAQSQSLPTVSEQDYMTIILVVFLLLFQLAIIIMYTY